MKHAINHQIVEIKYRNKLINIVNLSYLNLENVKYTISFNKYKTRAWHFFNSGDVFLKWEADCKESEFVELEIKSPLNKKILTSNSICELPTTYRSGGFWKELSDFTLTIEVGSQLRYLGLI